MATTRKPSNPTAAEALAEAAANPTFDFEGATYHVIPTDDWTIDTLEAFENQHLVAMIRGSLTAESYAQLRERHSKVSELNGFVAALAPVLGVSGN